MARTKRQYKRIDQAETMINKLCGTYKDVLWRVTPASIIVLGIDNSERSEKNSCLAKTRLIKGVERAVLELNNIKLRYIIELYGSDWDKWSEPQRQWILLHELLHVHENGDTLVKHYCEDFNIVIDAAGIKWVSNTNLPNLFDNQIDFDLNLRPGLEEYDGNSDGGDEIVESTSSKNESEDELVFDPE